jgi:hypothetical protein
MVLLAFLLFLFFFFLFARLLFDHWVLGLGFWGVAAVRSL